MSDKRAKHSLALALSFRLMLVLIQVMMMAKKDCRPYIHGHGIKKV